MEKNEKVYIAGHGGLIGSSILRRLINDGYTNILTRNHSELDLIDQRQVMSFFEKETPDYVFLAAARVGGVFANNTYRGEFIYENIMIQSNILHAAFLNEAKKVIFFACADIYPKGCPQPAREEYLLSGELESTCEPFAIAKLAGLKMCESYNRQYGTDFVVVIPPNVYGPNQHYDLMNSQVMPSLIRRFHDAKISHAEEVVIWGSGLPIRDFLFVDDAADAAIFLLNQKLSSGVFNIGTGMGITVRQVARAIKEAIGYNGRVAFDKSKPDGAAKKLLDTAKICTSGWRHKTELAEGIKQSYKAFLSEVEKKEIRSSVVCKIQPTEKDINIIDDVKSNRSPLENDQPDSYADKIVLKPWGYEFLVFDNECIAVWLLHIKKGHSTSMHCHPQKKTSLIALYGNAMSNVFLNRKYLKGGDALVLERGVFHSTKSLSEGGVFLLESESPPDKTDLLRLEDRYGREMCGYEGISEMRTEKLEDFNYFNFKECDHRKKYTYVADKFSLSLETYLNNVEFKKNFKPAPGGLYTSCRGKVFDKQGDILLDVGDTQKSEILSDMEGINVSGKTVLLKTITKAI